MIIRIKF